MPDIFRTCSAFADSLNPYIVFQVFQDYNIRTNYHNQFPFPNTHFGSFYTLHHQYQIPAMYFGIH